MFQQVSVLDQAVVQFLLRHCTVGIVPYSALIPPEGHPSFLPWPCERQMYLFEAGLTDCQSSIVLILCTIYLSCYLNLSQLICQRPSSISWLLPIRLLLQLSKMAQRENVLQKGIGRGTNPHRIVKENDDWFLIVNEALQPLEKQVLNGVEALSIVDITKEQKRNPYRYQIYRSVKQTATDSDWVYCGHKIDMQAILDKTNKSPRYLFRVTSDKSGGINTPEHFQSEAVKQESRADMASMKEEDVKENLLAHMRDTHFASHWISFTVSPLWAFDRALRLKAKGEKDICITIVDTLYLAQPVQIFHTPALLEAYLLEEAMWPIMNRGAAERLVWDEIIAPGTMIPLDNFLKSYVVEGDYLKPQYSAMQTFHFKPLDFAHQSTNEALKVLKQNPVRDLYAPCYIRARNYKSDTHKLHEIEVRKNQAPRTWKEKYTASRKFYGKKLNNWWDENARVPISNFTMGSYLELVEENFSTHQIVVIIALLSTRLYHFEYSSVVEAFEMLDSE